MAPTPPCLHGSTITNKTKSTNRRSIESKARGSAAIFDEAIAEGLVSRAAARISATVAAGMTYNFGLLDLADGESGDAAVYLVVGKKHAAAKLAAAAKPAATPEKAKCFSYYTKLKHDSGTYPPYLD